MGARSIEHAKSLEEKLPATLRDEFSIPTFKSLGSKDKEEEGLYFCGNSLGLMPKNAAKAVQRELQVWGDRGVNGHFDHPDGMGWVEMDDPLQPLLAPIVGAKKNSEVAIMNTLTSNLHSMMSSFYIPTKDRYKILFENKAFPSDTYAFQNQAKLHGYEIEDALIALSPRENEFTLREEDILKTIEEQGDKIAVVCFSGIQYYTGQLFNMEKITKAAKEKGCIVGWDLAHAAGNVPVYLHDWDVDFAVFCTYKYMNSGPGAIGALFVHSKYENDSRPRLAGWWGNKLETRFQMANEFDPIPGAAGYKMSNPSVLNVVCVRESLKLFQKAGGVEKLRERSLSMTNYLWDLLTSSKYYIPVDQAQDYDNINEPKFTILTPSESSARGAQLSVLYLPMGKGIMQHTFNKCEHEYGVIADERQPDVCRYAPNPFYNTHIDVLNLVKAIEESISTFKASS